MILNQLRKGESYCLHFFRDHLPSTIVRLLHCILKMLPLSSTNMTYKPRFIMNEALAIDLYG